MASSARNNSPSVHSEPRATRSNETRADASMRSRSCALETPSFFRPRDSTSASFRLGSRVVTVRLMPAASEAERVALRAFLADVVRRPFSLPGDPDRRRLGCGSDPEQRTRTGTPRCSPTISRTGSGARRTRSASRRATSKTRAGAGGSRRTGTGCGRSTSTTRTGGSRRCCSRTGRRTSTTTTREATGRWRG